MKELEVLSNQILDRTKSAGQKKVEQKEKELAGKLEENRVRFVEQQKARKVAIQSRSTSDYERQVQSLANEKRNRILAEKQRIMTAVYQEAIEKMSSWNAETFHSFVEAVLNQFEATSLQLTVGEKSIAHFTDAFKQSLKEKYPALTIADETVANKAGFVVAEGGVDYNFFFDQMVTEIKKDFSPKLASLAFQKNE